MIKLRIGDVLLEQGIITKEQLTRALEIQGQTGGYLGDVLQKNGFISEEELTRALSRQFGLPFASKSNGLLVLSEKDDIKALVPMDFAKSHTMAPLFIRDETLGIAISDPMDVITMDNLRILTGKNLMVYLAKKSEILSLIDELFGEAEASTIAAIAKEAATQADTSVTEAQESKEDLDKSGAEAGDAQVVQLVNQIIRQAIEEKASDIHVEPMEDMVSLRFRIDGILHEKAPPAKVLAPAMVSRIKILSKLNVAEKRLPQDGAIVVKHRNQMVDLRVSICPTVWGEKAVLRILNKQAVELDVNKLGMAPEQQEHFVNAASFPHGLIFVTGPTGSGKTTTLYAMLQHITSPDLNIMTIEDPVEFKMKSLNQVQVKPQIGLTFSSALKSFLRQDPDVILVGEVRDQETAELCVRAALTGHLVLSTLHTNDALSSILRLIDLGVEPFLVSSTLVLVAAQRLVRALCPDCKEAYAPQPGELKSLGFPEIDTMYKPKGCPKCVNTGYKGRRAIYEVIPVNEKLRAAIQQGATIPALKELAKEQKILSMKNAGFLKVKDGTTSLEELLSVIFADE
ncbi:GspE/PulE family protein [Elusimicrobiota bacterium]